MKKILQRRPEKKFSFGFICDPLDTFDREAETSLFLMREIASRGHSIFVCEPKDIFLKQNEVWAEGAWLSLGERPQRCQTPSGCFYRILRRGPISLAKLDCLFLRKDPPFDLNYLFHLWMLAPLEGKILMVNPPSAILKNNEKLSTLQFPFAPRTMVGSNRAGLLKWGSQFSNGFVIKPLNSSGGRGVQWIKKTKYQVLSTKYQVPIIAQEFLPAVRNGDKRVMLWNGKTLGTFVRKPTKPGEFRANLHLGGEFYKTKLTATEKKIVAKVAAWTKREKLYFVGLDLVGGKLTEINITSPMGIRELNVLYGMKVEKEIIDSVRLLRRSFGPPRNDK